MKITNKAPPLLPTIGGADLPPLITWKIVWSGLNLPRSASVGGSSPLFFDRVIVEFTFCVCRNSYGIIKTEIYINSLLSSLLDRYELRFSWKAEPGFCALLLDIKLC